MKRNGRTLLCPPAHSVHLPASSGARGGQPLHLGVPARHHAQRGREHGLPPPLPHLRVWRSVVIQQLIYCNCPRYKNSKTFFTFKRDRLTEIYTRLAHRHIHFFLNKATASTCVHRFFPKLGTSKYSTVHILDIFYNL